MSDVQDLLDRAVYSIGHVDRLLALKAGTARRWIDGYTRGGKPYPPVVRSESTGDETVTWGEFVETRLLSEYRDAGLPMIRMRPAVEKLRELFDRKYPLAHAQPYLDVEGRELVMQAQASVGLDSNLLLVVVRNDQLVLSPSAERFRRSAQFDEEFRVVSSLRPITEIEAVELNPLRQFGEPVVRSVPTAVIAEQIRSGDSIQMIADIYELSPHQVEAALRYELTRLAEATPAA